MFGGKPADVEWVAEVLPRVERLASDQHAPGSKDWTGACRSLLWRFHRERWRDDRWRLEQAQRQLERRRASQGRTHDLAAALRAAFQIRD